MLNFTIFLGPLVAVLGWFVAYRFSVNRDRLNKRRDMIAQFLLEAYRRLEAAANREETTEEQAVAFESAIADIQLLGTPEQITGTVKYLRAHASSGGADVRDVLCLLRNDLRRELGLSTMEDAPIVFRFKRHYDCGNWRGETVSRIDPSVVSKDK